VRVRRAKYYLANLAPEASLKTPDATIKARWICQQAHQQLNEELGLDHFEAGPIVAAPCSQPLNESAKVVLGMVNRHIDKF
jgi:hypothetical protein